MFDACGFDGDFDLFMDHVDQFNYQTMMDAPDCMPAGSMVAHELYYELGVVWRDNLR